jgi:IclR family transcriptional regulator, pca regulon regulatory protein
MSVSERDGATEPGGGRPSGKLAKSDPGFSQSIERGLAILSSFRPNRPLMGVSELSREVGLGRSTTHRYVATLSALGYLEQDPPSRKYRLGPKVIDLGFSAINSMELRAISQPYLQRLSDETGYTANMAILDDTDIIYIERCRSAKKGLSDVELDLHVGSRLPAYCTSMGKVLLAHLADEDRDDRLDRSPLKRHGPNTVTDRTLLIEELERVRATGIAINNEEIAFGIRAIAVPVRGRSGNVVASVGFGVHNSWIRTEDLVREMTPVLHNTAAEISARVGYH